MASLALGRLQEERKALRKDRPHGFYARPQTAPDGSANLMVWDCGIPGREGTDWEGGVYKLIMEFSEEYPVKVRGRPSFLESGCKAGGLMWEINWQPPQCRFVPPLFHPNVFTSGHVCLSILNAEKDWRPSITLRQVLIGIQDLLDNPNIRDPAQGAAYELFLHNRGAYNMRIREEAKKNVPTES